MCKYKLSLTKIETCYILALLSSINCRFVDYKSQGEGGGGIYARGSANMGNVFDPVLEKLPEKDISVLKKSMHKVTVFNTNRAFEINLASSGKS